MGKNEQRRKEENVETPRTYARRRGVCAVYRGERGK